MKLIAIFITLSLSFNFLWSQNTEDQHISIPSKKNDSTCLKDCVIGAHWEAHSRSFAMSTINQENLKDDYAIASGAGIGLLTKRLKGFQIGVSGFFIYNLHSTALYEKDSLTGLSNRYEVGLFDIQNPSNRNDLDRLEELYLKHSYSKSNVVIGKINLNTPFINPQDGRMRPTLSEGVWLSFKEWEKININGGWIWDVSPRSTVTWFKVAESIGVNPMGQNTDGTKSDYHANVEACSGLAITNLNYKPTEKIKINLWNAFLDNVMNTALIEINLEQSHATFRTYQGLIYLHQDAINYGGNIDQSKAYITRDAQSNVISSQLGIKSKRINTSMNYTHITGDGRYLMPKEWGREVFYTFLNRERNEGLGNVHAFMTKTTYFNKKQTFETALGYGFYLLPDVLNYRLNKYGMPSYHHINYYANYAFKNYLKGMEIKFLAAYKIKHGETYGNLKYIYNKVNMINLNLVIDYKI
ncbi:MAG: OprD family outer membrane porin [Bacteroidota bacterium]